MSIGKELSDNAIKELNYENENNDTETAHINADYILCQLLEKLGYTDVVIAYQKIDKWYA